MDDVRNESASNISLKKMDEVRDEATSSTSHAKGRMKDCKNTTIDESVASLDKMCEGRVRDRKKFFENHIFEQKRREKALVSPSSFGHIPQTTGTYDHLFIEERSDSESLFRNKNDGFEHERTDSEGKFYDTGDRTEPEPLVRAFIPKPAVDFDSGSDTDPSELIEQESSYYAAKERFNLAGKDFREKELHGIAPTVGNITVSHYIEKGENLDRKISSLPDINISNSIRKLKEEKEPTLTQVCPNERPEENSDLTKSSPASMNRKEDVQQAIEEKIETSQRIEENNKVDDKLEYEKGFSNLPIVKILVTNTRSENQDALKQEPNAEILKTFSERKVDIDEMITEFQQESEKLSNKLMTNCSPRNLVIEGFGTDCSNPAEVGKNRSVSQARLTNETSSFDSYFPPNNLSVDYYDELAERLHSSPSKNDMVSTDYVCPSESTDDDSVDSVGNSKTPKSVSSKSVKSLTKSRAKGSGMGKIFNKAKKGMGKSVKNLAVKSVSQISQLTLIMKHTKKTKPTKQSPCTETKTAVSVGRILDEKNTKKQSDFFDGNLAEVLVNNIKGNANFSNASRYLRSGERLLKNGVDLEEKNDLIGSKEVVRKAHTYAYVGRQLARHILLTYHRELSGENQPTNISITPEIQDDGITVIEDFFLSLLQCVGPTSEDDSDEISKGQVDETLEILSKLSKEEATDIKSHLSKEVYENFEANRKIKVEAAIINSLDFGGRDETKGGNVSNHDKSSSIRRFVNNLRLFYELDNTLNLSQIFSEGNQDHSLCSGDKRSVLNESLSYNYSEPLKFDHGRSFHTRSFTTAGSMKQEQSSFSSFSSASRRGRKPKEESLEGGIRPGTTVVSISVKNRNFKNKNKHNNTSNKKKQSSSKKWLSSRHKKTGTVAMN